jgi:hypothetical protein
LAFLVGKLFGQTTDIILKILHPLALAQGIDAGERVVAAFVGALSLSGGCFSVPKSDCSLSNS